MDMTDCKMNIGSCKMNIGGCKMNIGGCKMDIADFKPYIQDTCSLCISLFCCFAIYKHTQSNNIIWYNYIWFLFTLYLICDLYLGAGIDFWIHHIVSILLNIICFTYNDSAIYIIKLIRIALLTESSSIFLSIRSILRTYLKANKNTDTLLKKIQPVNEFLFYALFFYTRVYMFNKHIIFNPEFYSNILTHFNFYMIDKLLILCILILGLMNTYWFVLISKKGLTNYIGYNIFEYRPALNDPFLLQIEELRAKIHGC
jgi:hypothetical protein